MLVDLRWPTADERLSDELELPGNPGGKGLEGLRAMCIGDPKPPIDKVGLLAFDLEANTGR